MPIEIKELHIKINVDEGPKSGKEQQITANSKDGKEKIIAECVEAVMEIFNQQKER